jgi:hypothetical protein
MISGKIEHPIVIPVDFACWVFGESGSSIQVSTTADSTNAYGIVIGNTTQGSAPSGPASISIADTFISVSTTGNSSNSYGIRFNNEVPFGSNVSIINNTISSSTAGSTNSAAIGLRFYSFIKAPLTIADNTISASSASYSAYGIRLNDAITAPVTLSNNTISVSATSSTGAAYGIYLYRAISALVTVANNIVATRSNCDDSQGFYFNTIASTGNLVCTNNTISTYSLAASGAAGLSGILF